MNEVYYVIQRSDTMFHSRKYVADKHAILLTWEMGIENAYCFSSFREAAIAKHGLNTKMKCTIKRYEKNGI